MVSADESLNNDSDELATLARWLLAGQRGAIATVVRTWGSSPRPVGSHLVINERGEFNGSVSGGCIEGAVVTEAIEVIASGQPRLLEFGVSDEEAWEVGLSCGGAISVYVDCLSRQDLDALQRARAAGDSVGLVFDLKVGVNGLLTDGLPPAAVNLQDSNLATANEMLRSGRSGLLDNDDDAIFVRSYVPPARLLIVGAVHIAQLLAPMARLAGYSVTIIDPRSAFCNEARFPDVDLSTDWPDDALRRLAPDSQTAIVTLTHDPKIDDPALQLALSGPAFYVGSLGSKRTHARRLERLQEAGFEEELDRIHGPVGLPLGGRAASEIAVSILAEIIKTRYASAAGAGAGK